MGSVLAYMPVAHAAATLPQTRSEVAVGAAVWKVFIFLPIRFEGRAGVQLATGLHTRLEVAVGVAVWKVAPTTHSVAMPPHTRSEVAMGATD